MSAQGGAGSQAPTSLRTTSALDYGWWASDGPTDDLEAAWLPVLYDLVAYLDVGVGRFPSGRELPDPPGLGSQQSAWTRPLRSRATRRAGWAGLAFSRPGSPTRSRPGFAASFRTMCLDG